MASDHIDEAERPQLAACSRPVFADERPVYIRLPTPLLGSLDGEAGITSKRLWAMVKRFFATKADVLADTNPALAERLRQATPHWMRHTHATHALQRGGELTTVRDKLRHASLASPSMYLHSDDLRRAKQIGSAFEAPAV